MNSSFPPDPDLQKALNDLSIRAGKFWDLGAGPADQAFELARRGSIFQYAFDPGVFSALSPQKRLIYAETLRKIIWTGGILFLKCPYFSRPDLEKYFGKQFHIRSVKVEPKLRTLFCVLQCRK